jgi:hypothetical protein
LIEASFKKGHSSAVAIVTWGKRDRTLDKIGPCSTVAALIALNAPECGVP